MTKRRTPRQKRNSLKKIRSDRVRLIDYLRGIHFPHAGDEAFRLMLCTRYSDRQTVTEAHWGRAIELVKEHALETKRTV